MSLPNHNHPPPSSSPRPLPTRRHTLGSPLPPPPAHKTISDHTASTSDLSTAFKPAATPASPASPTSAIVIIPIPFLSILSAALLTASWIGAVLAAHLMQRVPSNLSRPPIPALPAISDVSRFPDAQPLFIFGLSLAGFFVSQLSLFLRLSFVPTRRWEGPLADFGLVVNGVGGLLLTIGSAIFIERDSHAAFLGIGTIFILFWMLIMAFLVRSRWAHVLKLATMCTLVGFAFTLRAAATKDPVYLPVGEYMVLSGISVYLLALAGCTRALKVKVQLEVLGRQVEERLGLDRLSTVI